jgi:ubiquitin-like protein 4
VINITLSNVNPSITTVAQLRESVQNELGGPAVVSAEKIKILHNRKPLSASKRTISDIFEGQEDEMGNLVEMGVMIIGRTPDPPVKSDARAQRSEDLDGTIMDASVPLSIESMEGVEKVSSPPPVQGARGKQILQTSEFWDDLQGYLEQRVKDEMEAARLVRKWKSSWNTD